MVAHEGRQRISDSMYHAMEQPAEMVKEYPVSSMLLAFGSQNVEAIRNVDGAIYTALTSNLNADQLDSCLIGAAPSNAVTFRSK